jgi:hypothetical protein
VAADGERRFVGLVLAAPTVAAEVETEATIW